MKTEIVSTPFESGLTTSDMKIGDIGVAEESAYPVAGTLILKAYGVYINLTDPSETWEDPAIRLSSILRKGTVIEITI